MFAGLMAQASKKYFMEEATRQKAEAVREVAPVSHEAVFEDHAKMDAIYAQRAVGMAQQQ